MTSNGHTPKPPPSALIYGICWPISLLLGLLGLYGDAQSWWNEQPYLTNMLTTITGALFGVPIVLDVFRRITALQAEEGNQRAIRRLLEGAVGAYIEAASGFIPGFDDLESLTELEAEISYLICRTDATLSIESHAASLYRNWEDYQHILVPYYPYMIRAMSDLVDDFERLRSLVERFSLATSEASSKKSEITASWEYLDVYVRPRVLEAGRQWLPAHVHSKIRDEGFPLLKLEDLSKITAPMEAAALEATEGYKSEYSIAMGYRVHIGGSWPVSNIAYCEEMTQLKNLRDDLNRIIELLELNKHLRILLADRDAQRT